MVNFEGERFAPVGPLHVGREHRGAHDIQQILSEVMFMLQVQVLLGCAIEPPDLQL